jgi:hypothetical protein
MLEFVGERNLRGISRPVRKTTSAIRHMSRYGTEYSTSSYGAIRRWTGIECRGKKLLALVKNGALAHLGATGRVRLVDPRCAVRPH